MADGPTRNTVVQQAAQRFGAVGIDGPLTDARLLVAHALGVDRMALVTHPDIQLSPGEAAIVEALVMRRLAREPVSRIIGERWFRGRPFLLSPATLDPRPDSETLIDVVLDFVRTRDLAQAPLQLLDIGTGTGCLLLTLLAELRLAVGCGIDLSPEALTTAATNATRLGIDPSRVTWLHGSGLEPANGRFNVIVANPPYIAMQEIAYLEPEVRCFDPLLALDGGTDGLDCYRQWTTKAWQALDPALGILVYEVGAGQAPAVGSMLAAATAMTGAVVSRHSDLGGIERCVSAATHVATSHLA